jgi:SAM-dependent methyltransferase
MLGDRLDVKGGADLGGRGRAMTVEFNHYADRDDISRRVQKGLHRDVVGGLWDEIGKLQFHYLVTHGLEPSSVLIDIGCGCLRGGVHFVAYLAQGKYFGVDLNKSLLDAGYDIELKAVGLQHKLPREHLVWNGDFDFEAFPQPFDFAIAQSLFTHIPQSDIRVCLERLSRRMKPGGELFATFFHIPEDHRPGEAADHPAGLRTFDARDPYHYRMSDMIRLCDGLPWHVTLAGEFGHPRGQQMLRFVRTDELGQATNEPSDDVRRLDYAAAAGLPPGAPHYRAFVGPPDRFDFMSATQFALLFSLGLRDHHRVLDFGCGSLRLGRLLIPFLRRGRYYGIDPNRWLIEDALSNELGHAIVRVKQPRFSYNDDFSCRAFGEKFDFIVAQSIITHCGPDLTETLVREVAAALTDSGIFVFSIIEDPARAALPARSGWIYPDCVAYGAACIGEICSAAGLHAVRLPWYHPGAVWYAAVRDVARLPSAREMPSLHGAVLFDPQFAGSRPAPRSDDKPANVLARFADHDDAVAAGRAHDLGTAVLLEPSVAVAGTCGRFRFRYTAGAGGLPVGATLRLALRHVCQWTPPQTGDPVAPGFTTVSASNGGQFSVIGWNAVADPGDLFLSMFPWQHVIDIRPVARGLDPGETIEIVYGNTDHGSPGVRIQFFEEPDFAFRAFVDAGDGRFLPLAPDLKVPIVGGEWKRLVLVTPSDARVGMPTRLLIRVEDRYGNVARDYRGRTQVSFDDGTGPQSFDVEFGEAERGLCRIDGIVFREPGVYTFRVADGPFESNPARVTSGAPAISTFWGELHGHTLASDGRGTIDQYYDYAAQVAGLDVCAVTDHDFMLSDAAWERSKKITNLHNRPGEFVTLQAFEWSGLTEVGGDHNVYFVTDDAPIVRSRSYFDYRNQQTFHGSDVCANHIEDVYNFLVEQCPRGTVMVVPHYGGRPANPKWHRPDLERLIEIFSEHRRSEDWAGQFHAAGYRLGNVAGGDDHIGRPGNGFLAYGDAPDDKPYGLGLVAIQAPSLTRESVFAALYDRRVYATTGARILLDVSIEGQAMGSELACSTSPSIHVDVVGTADIAVVQILRGDGVAYEFRPGDSDVSRRSVRFDWTDRDLRGPRTVAYTLRVVQTDDELAVSSPIVCDVSA